MKKKIKTTEENSIEFENIEISTNMNGQCCFKNFCF